MVPTWIIMSLWLHTYGGVHNYNFSIMLKISEMEKSEQSRVDSAQDGLGRILPQSTAPMQSILY